MNIVYPERSAYLESEVETLKRQVEVLWRALKKSSQNLDFGGDPAWLDVYCSNLVKQAEKEIENGY